MKRVGSEMREAFDVRKEQRRAARGVENLESTTKQAASRMGSALRSAFSGLSAPINRVKSGIAEMGDEAKGVARELGIAAGALGALGAARGAEVNRQRAQLLRFGADRAEALDRDARSLTRNQGISSEESYRAVANAARNADNFGLDYDRLLAVFSNLAAAGGELDGETTNQLARAIAVSGDRDYNRIASLISDTALQSRGDLSDVGGAAGEFIEWRRVIEGAGISGVQQAALTSAISRSGRTETSGQANDIIEETARYITENNISLAEFERRAVALGEKGFEKVPDKLLSMIQLLHDGTVSLTNTEVAYDSLAAQAELASESGVRNLQTTQQAFQDFLTTIGDVLNVFAGLFNLLPGVIQQVVFLASSVGAAAIAMSLMGQGTLVAATASRAAAIANALFSTSFWAGVIPALWATVAATWAWTVALLANPATWIVLGIVAAIAGLVVGIRLVVRHWDTITETVKRWWDALRPALMTAVTWAIRLNPPLALAIWAFRQMVGLARRLWATLGDNAVINWLIERFQALWGLVGNIVGAVSGLFGGGDDGSVPASEGLAQTGTLAPTQVAGASVPSLAAVNAGIPSTGAAQAFASPAPTAPASVTIAPAYSITVDISGAGAEEQDRRIRQLFAELTERTNRDIQRTVNSGLLA